MGTLSTWVVVSTALLPKGLKVRWSKRSSCNLSCVRVTTCETLLLIHAIGTLDLTSLDILSWIDNTIVSILI